MKLANFEGSQIKIGKNAQENWDLLDSSNPSYVWFHLKSFPSCFVIIENEEPSNELIQHAAELCKSNTKYRNLNNLKINFTKVGNLKKVGKTGTVEFLSKKKVFTINV